MKHAVIAVQGVQELANRFDVGNSGHVLWGRHGGYSAYQIMSNIPFCPACGNGVAKNAPAFAPG
jgi:hypothetical protein